MVKIAKKNLLYGLFVIGLILAVCFCWRENLSDHRSRAEQIGDALERITGEQQQAIDDLTGVANGLGSSAECLGGVIEDLRDAEGDIADAQSGFDSNAEEIRSNAERIRECQRILTGIRARGKAD